MLYERRTKRERKRERKGERKGKRKREGKNEAELEVVLKNNGTTQWPMNKTKLIANDKKNLIGKNIELEPQNPDDIKKYIVNFNELKPYPPGDYTAGFFFEVDGKKYGDDIELDIIIKDKGDDEEENGEIFNNG